MTCMWLELLTGPDMYLFVERGVRGDITQVSNRCVETNNIYMGEDYNPSVVSKYICYFDVKGLYSHTMRSKLPIGNFEWVEADMFSSWDFANKVKDGDTCFVVEMDLSFPEECHYKLSDRPLPQKMAYPRMPQMRIALLDMGAKLHSVHCILCSEQKA
ncbi:hypothetical protein PR048_029678 [Dryococelus australis]|uniref:DNA-directed DNA polymerase n=1 Tax=Dryococelus australis TaxID=614101 RepID=A0ABQ9GE13_9NEOP|nr:hypothetical protein PR048_029678 [Dryococelus australis]